MARNLHGERRDEIAREAARLLRDGRAEDIPSAIRAALRGAPGAEEIPASSVREHARGLALEALGAEAYREQVAEVLDRAEETMTLLATQLAVHPGAAASRAGAARIGDAPVALVGRAAKAQVDADPCCRIRVETDRPVGDIAALLVSAGLDEPAFSTLETRWGRLDRLVVDDGGVETRILRLPPSMSIPLDANLAGNTPVRVPSLDLGALRRLIGAMRMDTR